MSIRGDFAVGISVASEAICHAAVLTLSWNYSEVGGNNLCN